MRHGHHTHLPTGKIDYKQLRKINPEAARRAVLEYLRSNGHNISQTALVFGINRTVIYDILRKERGGNLKDRSRAPRNQPRRTPALLEDKVIELIGPGMGQKGYHAISSNMKAYPFLQGQSGISSGETKIRLNIFPIIGSGKREESLSTGTQPSPLKSYRWT
jgi:hypothetical protein